MPLPPSPGRLRKLSKLPQDGPKMALSAPFWPPRASKIRPRSLKNGEKYMPVHSNLQFALNSHIPDMNFTLASLLPVVYGQDLSVHASQLDVDGSLLTGFDDNGCDPDKRCQVFARASKKRPTVSTNGPGWLHQRSLMPLEASKMMLGKDPK